MAAPKKKTQLSVYLDPEVMKTLSAYLYSSDLYRRGELGIHGEFGGNLSIPAPKELLGVAPYPF